MNRYIRNSFLILIASTNLVFSTIIDNRYFPYFERVFSRSTQRKSRAGCDLFFMTSKHAIDKGHEKFGLPEIYGCFDQIVLGKALKKIGKTNPLRDDFEKLNSINWKMDGKIQAQGFNILIDKSLSDNFSCGFSTGFMHVNSSILFFLPPSTIQNMNLDTGGMLRLDSDRREMFKELSLEAPQWSSSSLMDSEVYLRIGKIWEYIFKTRRIDLNGQIGCLIPTGQKRNENNPASIAFGANGHWGISSAINLDFELKEDLVFGISTFMNKRFERTYQRRMPVLSESPLFGAIITDVTTNPGFTIGFSPYLIVEELREGLGCYARYFYVNHFCDVLKDARLIKNIKVNLGNAQNSSKWVAEYFSFNVFYDFGKTNDEHSYVPRATIVLDVPVNLFGSSLSSRTYKVSVGFEVYF